MSQIGGVAVLAEECCSKHVALLLTLCKCYSLIHKILDHKCKRTRSVTTLSGLKHAHVCKSVFCECHDGGHRNSVLQDFACIHPCQSLTNLLVVCRQMTCHMLVSPVLPRWLCRLQKAVYRLHDAEAKSVLSIFSSLVTALGSKLHAADQ